MGMVSFTYIEHINFLKLSILKDFRTQYKKRTKDAQGSITSLHIQMGMVFYKYNEHIKFLKLAILQHFHTHSRL